MKQGCNVDLILVEIPYEVAIHTGDVRGAGTDANVILVLYGEKGKSDEFKLRNKTDNFERAKVDKFKVCSLHFTPFCCTLLHYSTPKDQWLWPHPVNFSIIFNPFKVESEDIGALTKIRVGHDNSGFGAAWYLDKVSVCMFCMFGIFRVFCKTMDFNLFKLFPEQVKLSDVK